MCVCVSCVEFKYVMQPHRGIFKYNENFTMVHWAYIKKERFLSVLRFNIRLNTEALAWSRQAVLHCRPHRVRKCLAASVKIQMRCLGFPSHLNQVK